MNAPVRPTQIGWKAPRCLSAAREQLTPEELKAKVGASAEACVDLTGPP